MKKPPHVMEIFLQPGEFYWGNADTRIRTLLGSCVAVTLWHPLLLVGGMCHYLLPKRATGQQTGAYDGRYAEDAIQIFMRELSQIGTKPGDYEVKMFGGGNQFHHYNRSNLFSIPDKNIQAGKFLLEQHGFQLKAAHIGGDGHRNVMFDIWSGHVWMRHIKNSYEDKE